MNDDRRDPATEPRDDPATGRRALWSRRVAIAILLTFAAFVVFNVTVVLVLAIQSAVGGGGGPFGT